MNEKSKIGSQLTAIFLLLIIMFTLMNIVLPNIIDEQDEIVLVEKIEYSADLFLTVHINSSINSEWRVHKNIVRNQHITEGSLIWLFWELENHVFWTEWVISSWFFLG